MEVMEQLGVPFGEDHGMVDHILTESGQSIYVLKPEAITKANDTDIEVYQDAALILGYDRS